MPNLADLSVLLENVWLGNTINECVLNIKDSTATVKAMDMTSSVYVETSAVTQLKNDTLAFGNLGLLIKYLKSTSGIEAEVARKDNRLTIKPKGGATLQFLLSEPDLIPTYDASWENENRIDALVADYNAEMILTKESVSEFSSLMKMFGTKSAILKVSAKGNVTIVGGNDTEHKFTATLGLASALPECEINIIVKNFLAVLDILDYTENPTIMVCADHPILIACKGTTWVLNSNSDDESTENK